MPKAEIINRGNRGLLLKVKVIGLRGSRAAVKGRGIVAESEGNRPGQGRDYLAERYNCQGVALYVDVNVNLTHAAAKSL